VSRSGGDAGGRLVSPRARHGIAAVAVTAPGAATALRIAGALGGGATAYVPARFLPWLRHEAATSCAAGQVSVVPYSVRVASLISDLFAAREALVLVMAAGAAVRMLAPLLLDKRSDPGVVVIDDAGRFAVSLLSGHQGGANKLAEQIARALDATAVVTTASEVAGVPAPDLLGRDLGWKIEPDAELKRVAAALVNGEVVGFVQDAGPRSWIPAGTVPNLIELASVEALAAAGPAAAIVISERLFELPKVLSHRTAIYRPPVLVLGIGCVKGAEQSEIERLIRTTLEGARLSELAVARIATIDRKAGEPGLVAACTRLGWPLQTFSPAELESAGGDWQRSEVVHRAVGSSGVAEPAALLGAGANELLVPKVKTKRVTLAVARVES